MYVQSEGRHVFMPLLSSVTSITFWKVQIENAFSPVRVDGM